MLEGPPPHPLRLQHESLSTWPLVTVTIILVITTNRFGTTMAMPAGISRQSTRVSPAVKDGTRRRDQRKGSSLIPRRLESP